MNLRIGQGYDVHRLAEGLPFYLGGVKIEHTKGCIAHSDGDTFIHALCDALLGAAAMRDIGYHFPPVKGNEYENIDSKILLRKVMHMLREAGYELGNCDCTICAEAPKLNPYIPAMIACLAEVMGVKENQISIKATTTEQLGFVGRKEGIAAQAVALIIKN